MSRDKNSPPRGGEAGDESRPGFSDVSRRSEAKTEAEARGGRSENAALLAGSVPPDASPHFLAEVDAVIDSFGKDRHQLTSILVELQRRFHYLPEAALRRVCEQTGASPADVAGVATFYAGFRLTPAGRHRIRVCIGTACHVKGADAVYKAFRQYLGIPENGDTDADRVFTVEKVACLGCCMLAPAVQIDDIVYGFLSVRRVPHVIREFLQHERAEDLHGTSSGAGAGGEARLCLCSSCAAGGAAAVWEELRRHAGRLGFAMREVGCTGASFEAPQLELVTRSGLPVYYGRVRPEDVRAIVDRHFLAPGPGRVAAALGHLLDRWAAGTPPEAVVRYSLPVHVPSDAAYWSRQVPIATEHGGELDPLDCEAYRAAGGFAALEAALRLDPAEIRRIVERSGLRGRGGAGYPTGRKWDHVARHAGLPKYVICNGDEGDPGAFMDRMILESFPFRVIEGMLIAARAVGADQGVFYIRGEYPLAVSRVRSALQTCRERGIIGRGVMSSGWAFDARVVEGAGAFVCGEETALIASLQGQRGAPRYRPPYPSEAGLFNRPTLVNNVETLAVVPWILRKGAEAFAAIGTAGSKGTKAFALAGRVLRGGLIEVPMGMPLRTIVEEIGGIPEGERFKAVQIGGPSGGCVPASLAHLPVDYEDLTATGAIMGSGGLIVLSDADCMVDIARKFLTFTQAESCGKCAPCRVGTRRMLDILVRLCDGRGRQEDVRALEELAHQVASSSLCGLGRTAPNPVLTTLKHFREEYDAHVQGRCPAGRCKALIRYVVTDKCIGCTLCAQHCPADAIPMNPHHRHEIDSSLCVRCDTCRHVCPAGAIEIRSTNDD
jgi:NADH-quinone oxidoreductase subunit F